MLLVVWERERGLRRERGSFASPAESLHALHAHSYGMHSSRTSRITCTLYTPPSLSGACSGGWDTNVGECGLGLVLLLGAAFGAGRRAEVSHGDAADAIWAVNVSADVGGAL